MTVISKNLQIKLLNNIITSLKKITLYLEKHNIHSSHVTALLIKQMSFTVRKTLKLESAITSQSIRELQEALRSLNEVKKILGMP